MDIEEEEPTNKRRTRGRAAAKSNMVPNPPAKELLPWVHQKNQGYRLIVSKQCEDEFYKDQGGKNHHLAMVVRLVPSNQQSMAQYEPGVGQLAGELSKDSTIKIPLKTSLLYENGAEVEEEQKIFKPMIPDHENFKLELRYTEGYWCYEGEVKFRLEKVSLRCDGKKFKLSIAVDVGADKIREMESDAVQAGSKAGALAPWIREISRAGGCETVGINVLSKKKSNANNPAPAPRSTEDTSRSRGGGVARPGPSHSGQPQKRARTGDRGGGGYDSHASSSSYAGSAASAKDQQAQNDIILTRLASMQESFEIGIRTLHQRLGAIDQRLDFLQQAADGTGIAAGGGGSGGAGAGGAFHAPLNRLGSDGTSGPVARGVSFGDSNGRTRQSSEPFQGQLARMSSTGEPGPLMSMDSMGSFEGPLPLGNLDRMASLNMAPPGGLGRLPSWQPDLTPYPSDGSAEGSAASGAGGSNAEPPRDADGNIAAGSFERQPSFNTVPTTSAMDALSDAASSVPKATASKDSDQAPPPPPTDGPGPMELDDNGGGLAGPPKLRKGSSAQD